MNFYLNEDWRLTKTFLISYFLSWRSYQGLILTYFSSSFIFLFRKRRLTKNIEMLETCSCIHMDRFRKNSIFRIPSNGINKFYISLFCRFTKYTRFLLIIDSHTSINQLCAKFYSEEVNAILTIKKVNLLNEILQDSNILHFCLFFQKKAAVFIILLLSLALKVHSTIMTTTLRFFLIIVRP